jgi:hypothetical protein
MRKIVLAGLLGAALMMAGPDSLQARSAGVQPTPETEAAMGPHC